MKHSHAHPSRRDALRLGALGAVGFGMTSAFARSVAAFAPQSGSNEKLLLIFMRGGWDGVNVAIPHGDGQYNLSNRPTLYVAPGQSLPIEPGNAYCMLHPALQSVQPMLASGEIVFLHRVGNPERSGSHFIDQQAWETGILPCVPPAGFDVEEGWVPRLQARLLGSGFRSASVSQNLQQFFQTADRARVQPHIRRIRDFPADTTPFYSFTTPKPALDAKYRGQGPSPANPFGYGLRGTNLQLGSGLDDYNRGAGVALLDSETQVSLLGAYVPSSYQGNQATYPFGGPNPTYYPAPAAVGLPGAGWVAPFFMELRDAFQLLLQTSANVIGIELGGVDTHTGQGGVNGELADRLKVLSYALRSVYWDSKGTGLAPRLTTLVVSEFGRTSQENSSGGTDHGAATLAIAMGERTVPNGGSLVYNCNAATWPSGTLFSANDSHYGCNPTTTGVGTYVKHLTDFRGLFAEVLTKLYGANTADLDAIIPGAATVPQLSFLV